MNINNWKGYLLLKLRCLSNIRYCRVYLKPLINKARVLYGYYSVIVDSRVTSRLREYIKNTWTRRLLIARDRFACIPPRENTAHCARDSYILLAKRRITHFVIVARWYKGMSNFRFRRKLRIATFIPPFKRHGKLHETFPRSYSIICPWFLIFLSKGIRRQW